MAYFEITKLPLHGRLSVHSEFYGDVEYFEYDKDLDPKNKRFDGHFLYIKYSPNNGFTGEDYFKYYVVDKLDKKSNEGIVKMNYIENIKNLCGLCLIVRGCCAPGRVPSGTK